MRVYDGVHIGPAQVDLRVQMELHRRSAVARERVAVKVDVDEVVLADAAADRVGGIDHQAAAVRQARTEMTVEVNDLLALKHGEGEGQLLAACFKVHVHVSWWW